MTDADSPFLRIPESDWVASNPLAFAVRDAFPVSEGHTLVIPRRLAADWDAVTSDERLAILALVDEVKAQLRQALHPDGFNLGINEGAAAGQTVFHLHVHVIPRFTGDVPDPRGGIRHAVMGKGNWETL
jgi:diadenosine tetraphosphate (Ap4A) HIT family hydrolase